MPPAQVRAQHVRGLPRGLSPLALSSFADTFLQETVAIVERLDRGAIEKVARGLVVGRDRGGRLFVLGVGGSAAHASHAANDFRKLCGLETYAPTDNVSELTARVNDDGWETVFAAWLAGSRLRAGDVLILQGDDEALTRVGAALA